MATTVRLLASTYALSNTSYLSIANTSNMYTNTDSTTYARISHTRAATTAYYVYVRGFNFSSIPSNATVTSAVVKVKAKVTSYSAQTPILYNGTTSLSKNLSGTISTSAVTRTVDITSSWDTYKGYGNNFGIRLAIGRSNKNTASYLDIYGAEITVTYELPSNDKSGAYLKLEGQWIQASKIYEKIDGTWTEIDKSQIDITKRFKIN